MGKYRKASAAATVAELFQRNPDLAAENPRLHPAAIDGQKMAQAIASMAPALQSAFQRAPTEHEEQVAQSIVLALPPSANIYWRYGSGGVHVSEEAKNYKAGVAWKALHQRMVPFAGPVAVYVNVYRSRKAGDLDNYNKVLLDALKGVAYSDDDQVVELHAWRHDDKDNPRVEVEIRKVEGVC